MPVGSDVASNVAARWGRAMGHFSNSVLQANRAATAAFTTREQPNGTEHHEPAVEEVAYSTPDWEFSRSSDSSGELGVGDVISFEKEISASEVGSFASITGDTNRLHLDEEFAEETRFGRRIVHGTLASGLISAALARMPGLTIYLSQDLEFRDAVDIGSTVTARCEIVEALGDDRYRLTTRVMNQDDELVIDGEAIVLIDDDPDAEAAP